MLTDPSIQTQKVGERAITIDVDFGNIERLASFTLVRQKYGNQGIENDKELGKHDYNQKNFTMTDTDVPPGLYVYYVEACHELNNICIDKFAISSPAIKIDEPSPPEMGPMITKFDGFYKADKQHVRLEAAWSNTQAHTFNGYKLSRKEIINGQPALETMLTGSFSDGIYEDRDGLKPNTAYQYMFTAIYNTGEVSKTITVYVPGM